MRVIVWGINYSPELTGIAPFNTGLCDYLVERGHHVEMVTTFPYYPFWQKIPGDRGKLYRTDDSDGVRVHRCWHHVPAAVTNLRRMWHELSFGFTSFVRVLFLARPDIYIIVSPPLLLGPLAAIMGWLKRSPYVFHVQDLQPDAAVSLGMVRVGVFTRLLYRVERWSYRHAAVVSGISEAMIAAFAKKGVPPTKRVLFPNWIRWYGRNAEFLQTAETRWERGRKFRGKFGLPADVFLASYSGNLGRKQGLETLLAAAEVLSKRRPHAGNEMMPLRRVTKEENQAIRDRGSNAGGRRVPAETSMDSAADILPSSLWPAASPAASAAPQVLVLIVGDGVMRAELTRRIMIGGLENVRLMPLLIEADYHGMLAASDVSLILQASGTGQHFFPSKLLSVLSMRSPVLSVSDVDSELAKAVTEGGFGLNVQPANPEALADALSELAADPGRLWAMAEKAEWVRRYSGSRVLGDFEMKLREQAGGH